MPTRSRLLIRCALLLALLGMNSARGQTAGREKEADPPRTDRYGDPLPPGAVARLGTIRLRQPGGVRGIAYSPDGKHLASVGDGTLRIWDARTGKQLHQFGKPRTEDAPAGQWGTAAVAYSPDGRLLATAGEDLIRVGGAATGRQRFVARRPAGRADCLAISPDGKTLAVGGGGKGHRGVVLLDLKTGKVQAALGKPSEVVHTLAFSPDGKTLATGSQDTPVVRLWEVRTGKELHTFPGHTRMATAVAISPNGKLLASGGDGGSLRLWDPHTGKQVRILRGPHTAPGDGPERRSHRVLSVCFSPDGEYLASADHFHAVSVWEVATGKIVRTFKGPGRVLTQVAFSPDGKHLASGSYGGAVRIWDVARGRPVTPTEAHIGGMIVAAFSPDGKLAASSGEDGTVRLWDPSTGKQLRVFRELKGFPIALVFSPDGQTLAVGGAEETEVHLWDVTTGKHRGLPEGYRVLYSLAFSPDGRVLATAGNDGPVRAWDPRTGKELPRPSFGAGIHTGLWFSPDGRLLAGSDAEQVRLWEWATGKQVRRFAGWSRGTFSADGRLLVTMDKGRSFVLHDVANGRVLLRFGSAAGEDTEGAPFALSPDGRMLVASGGNNALRLWELATGKVRQELLGHCSSVNSASFSPDGRRLLTSSWDSTGLVWELLPAKKTGGVGLSEGELKAFWSDLGGDATRAWQAIRTLAGVPGQAVSFLGKHVEPPRPADSERVANLIANLASPQFATREKANKELQGLGDRAESALRERLEKKPDLETRRRVEALLDRLRVPTGERLRAVRAVEVLEYVDTPEARRLLRKWADGVPGTRLTREAKLALERLHRR
jgi:WD40 repeat protein